MSRRYRNPKCPGCGEKDMLEIRVIVDCPIIDFRNDMPVYEMSDGIEQAVTMRDKEVWCGCCESWYSLHAFIEANKIQRKT